MRLLALLATTGLAFAHPAKTPDVAIPTSPMWVRLTSPVSSYTAKPGDPVRAVLTEQIHIGGVMLRRGCEIDGEVQSVRKVGWGIRHETAALNLHFTAAIQPDGSRIPLSAGVEQVENAREEVKHGVIQGIRSSKTAQGQINSRLAHLPTWNPYSDMGLIVYKAAFPIFPEPEIYLPAGTDLQLSVAETSVADNGSASPPTASEMATLQKSEQLSLDLPLYTTTTKGVEADLVNLVFLGTRSQVEAAFRAAGWNTSDPYSKHSVMEDFYAVLNDSGYAQAPMRPLLLKGQPAEMNWQKSLNSYAKRDHLRVWQWPGSVDGQQIWVSSSTHDNSAWLSWKYHRFVHHISPDIDDERSKVIRDLRLAGCVQSTYLLPRNGVPSMFLNAVGDPVRTDGELAVVQLQDCNDGSPAASLSAANQNYKPSNVMFRYLRRQILTFRSDIWRANIIYGLADVGVMAVSAMRHHPAATTDLHPKPPTGNAAVHSASATPGSQLTPMDNGQASEY